MYQQNNNAILHQLFMKSELSWAFSDTSKAIGPIVDLMFISLFIGASGVTVMGYVSPLIMLVGFIGTCVSNGARNIVSSMLGAGNIDEANSVFSSSIALGIGVSVFAAVMICIFCSGVSLLLGAQEPQIFAMTKLYIFGYIIGLPFLILIRILTPYLQMEGQYGIVNTSSLLITVIDIVLDAFVIFVLHGGMFWIGLATSLGYIIPCIMCAAFFLRRKNTSVFHLSLKGVKPKICFDILRLGAPSGITRSSNALGGILINNILTTLHMPYLVASYGVFSQLTVFVRSSWYAPSDTLMSFAGIFIGEEDKTSLKEIQKLSLVHSTIYCCIVTALLFVLAVPLSKVFLKSNDPEALRMSVECIRVACFSLPFHGIVYSFNNYLMAVKRLRFCNFYSFLLECGNIVPVTFFLLQVIDYRGAWVSRVENMFILSVIAAVYVYFHKGGKSYTDKMLLLPESFGINPEDEIAVTASSTDEIVDLSRLAVAFAAEHGADMKKAKTFGLITEELAGVLTEHGFSDGKKHNINARLVAKGDELIIRMRDDCKLFNMTEYYKELTESKEQDIGLAIIMKKSREVTYTNTLGVNNLIVRL